MLPSTRSGEALDRGEVRVAEPDPEGASGAWRVNVWGEGSDSCSSLGSRDAETLGKRYLRVP